MFDFPDLYREAANALKSKRHFEEALRYYKPLQRVTEYVDVSLLLEVAFCYRAVGLLTQAENSYNAILEIDSGSTEARIALWNMAKDAERARPALGDVVRMSSTPKKRPRKRLSVINTRKTRIPDSGQTLPQCLSQPRQLPRLIKKSETNKAVEQEAEVQALYSRWKNLNHERRRDVRNHNAWFEATRLLLQTFMDNRVFYPTEKNNKFYGYSKEARALANRRKNERDGYFMNADSFSSMLKAFNLRMENTS